MLSRLAQVLRDRQKKQAMTDASYWDGRAKTRQGFARSVWHSETFSQVWDERQQQILRDALEDRLGSLVGKRVADVGCGTGRITRFLAAGGANAVGFDFSPETVRAAREESTALAAHASFVVSDVTSGKLEANEDTFDAALTVGCLAVACRDLAGLTRSFQAIADVVKIGAPVIVLEPIHTSKFLGRVLRAPVGDWVDAAAKAGLLAAGEQTMGFVPTRLAFSSLDLPEWVVRPVFSLGERALERYPALERASDYRMLVFRREA
jgi:SAM-dependent methyltransferase